MSKPMDVQRKALGKGLSALLPQRNSGAQPQTAPREEVAQQPRPSPSPSEKPLARMVPLDWIQPNPSQPRQDFPEAGLSELAQSIRANGIIQPITATEAGENRYFII